MDERIGYYLIHNPVTEKVYIGSGLLESRWKSHFSYLRNNNHPNYKLQKAFNDNPNFDFIPVIIDEYPDPEMNRRLAYRIEQELIDTFHGSEVCLNIAKDVELCFRGRKHKPESNEKNRLAAIERWKDKKYRKKQIEIAKQGWRNQSPERKEEFKRRAAEGQRKRYSNGERSPTFGQKRSDEFCEKNRRMMLGNDYAPRHEVFVGDRFFKSITEAAKHFGISQVGATYRFDSTSNRFKDWRYS